MYKVTFCNLITFYIDIYVYLCYLDYLNDFEKIYNFYVTNHLHFCNFFSSNFQEKEKIDRKNNL